MLEKTYPFTNGNEKKIEKIIDDQAVMINHMIFPEGEGLKEHYSNSNVYMTILRGTISLNLADQGIHEYEGGTMVAIPNNTKMHIQNLHKEPLEVIIVKAPAPKEG